MNEARKKFRNWLAAGITGAAVVLGATGCASVSQEAKFAQTEANDLNEFTDAYNANNIKRMEEIITETQKQLKTLGNEKDKAEKYEKDNAEELATQYIMVGNECAVMAEMYGQKTGAENGKARPESTSFFNNVMSFATGAFNWLNGVLSGNPIPKATESAVEYAKENPDWKSFADAMTNTYEAYYGEPYVDSQTNGTNSQAVGETVQNAAGAVDDAAQKAPEVANSAGQAIQGAAGAVAEAAGNVAGRAVQGFEDAQNKYAREVSTDQYGNYVNVDNLAWLDMEAATINVKIGKWLKITDPNNPAEFHFYENPDYDNSNYEEDYKKAKEEMYGEDQR